MKKTLFFYFLIIVFSSYNSYSQVKYTSSGDFGIGTPTPEQQLHIKGSAPYLYLDAGNDQTGTIRFGETNYWRGAYMRYNGSSNKLILGVHDPDNITSSYDKDIFSISRSTGNIVITHPSASEYAATLQTVALNDYTKCYIVKKGTTDNFFVYGKGKVWHSGIQQLSDASIKENVKSMTSSVEVLSQLRPVSFNYTPEAFSSSPTENPETEYGLIAQEVELIIPDIVEERDDGMKGIGYTELIPFLIGAIQEQQKEIQTLKSQITDHSENNLKSLSYIENDAIGFSNAELFQNVPNPFNQSTTIRYNLPEIDSYAMINIYDLQGKQITSHNLKNAGEGEIDIPASSLSPGIYVYNLLLDGQVVDSKQMILTD